MLIPLLLNFESDEGKGGFAAGDTICYSSDVISFIPKLQDLKPNLDLAPCAMCIFQKLKTSIKRGATKCFNLEN